MIQDWLDSKGISYRTTGVDISPGWVGISCPFCPDGDHAFHLGIHLSGGGISCWRCSAKGTILKLVMKIEKVGLDRAREVLKKHQMYLSKTLSEEPQGGYNQFSPPNTVELLHEHEMYLLNRHFDPEALKNKYKIASFPPVGDFKHRVYIPVILNHKEVSYLGRDFTDIQNEKYKNCPNEKSAIPIKSTLYNIDRATDTVIITEGVTDVWRIGDGCVATFGKQFTFEQIGMIANRKIQRTFVFYDSDALGQADKLAYSLRHIVSKTEILSITCGDPADMTQDDVKCLRKDIFSKIY